MTVGTHGAKPASGLRMATAALAGAIIIGGAASVSAYAWKVHQGKAAVRLRLKDPASAMFEQVAYFHSTGATCGAVNAKNSFGGYVGFRGFVIDRDGALTIGEAWNTEVGTPQERLAAVQRAIQFRELLDKQCPGIAP